MASHYLANIDYWILHPGLPAYLPGKKKPADKDHAIAFETRDDAERFCWWGLTHYLEPRHPLHSVPVLATSSTT